MIKYFCEKTNREFNVYKIENENLYEMHYDPAAKYVWFWREVRFYSSGIGRFAYPLSLEDVIENLRNEPEKIQAILRDI